jgi:hypothetical protein
MNGSNPDSDAYKKVAVAARDYERATRVPGEFIAEMARASSTGHEAWRAAREQADFRIFEPHLSRMFDLKRRFVEFFHPPLPPVRCAAGRLRARDAHRRRSGDVRRSSSTTGGADSGDP